MARVRRRKSLAKRVEALERAAASQEASAAPTRDERGVEADRIRVDLWARLEKLHGMASGPPETVELTRQQAELAARFDKLHDSHKAKPLRGPKQEEVEQKISPVAAEDDPKPTGNDIARAFSKANRGGFESDDYSNVKGMSEGELWAWQARHLPSE